MRSTNHHYAPSARSESQALITNSKSPAILFAVIAAVAFESTLAPTINNNFIPHLDKVVHFFTLGLIAWLLGVMISQLTFSLSSGECRWRQRISRRVARGHFPLRLSQNRT